MRVLYVSKALVVAAYRSKLRELARHVEVEAVVPERWGDEPPEASPAGVPEPLRVRARLHGHNHLHVYRDPAGWMDRARPDLVHVDEEPYSLVTLQLARLCRRRALPFVFFAWQNLPKRLPFPFEVLRRRVYRAAAGAIAGTGGAARVLEDSGYRGPTAVIPQFGVDPERFAPSPDARLRVRARVGIPDHAFVVGYGGRLVPEKGVDVLLDAFGRLRPGADGVAPHLLVVGDGPERKGLEREAVRGGLESRIRLVGRRPSLEVPPHLAAMDVLVLPSVGSPTWSEQFGRILVEAMACGTPVVATRCGEIPDVVGTAGDLVPAGDPAALAAALERLQRDPALRRERSAAGRRRILERFTQARVAGETAEFYASVVDGRGA